MRDSIWLPAFALIATIALLSGIISTGVRSCVAQESDPVQEPTIVNSELPEFIVIFDYPTSSAPLNLRMIIRARTEGEAVMKATLSLVDSFRNQMEFSKLKFLEVAPKLPAEKKR